MTRYVVNKFTCIVSGENVYLQMVIAAANRCFLNG